MVVVVGTAARTLCRARHRRHRRGFSTPVKGVGRMDHVRTTSACVALMRGSLAFFVVPGVVVTPIMSRPGCVFPSGTALRLEQSISVRIAKIEVDCVISRETAFLGASQCVGMDLAWSPVLKVRFRRLTQNDAHPMAQRTQRRRAGRSEMVKMQRKGVTLLENTPWRGYLILRIWRNRRP